jgi:hypothetical protein
VDVHPTDFSRPGELMARAEAAAHAFLRERSADVVALRDHRRTRGAPTAPGALPTAG